MADTVNKIYTDITIEDKETIRFSDEVVGGLRPKSLDYLTKAYYITWGRNMTDLIEPKVIPSCCIKLLLPISYAHPIADTKLKRNTRVYVHHTNVRYAPTNCSFYVWIDDSDSINDDLDDLTESCCWDPEYLGWTADDDFTGILVRCAHPVPPGTHQAMIEPKGTSERRQNYYTLKRAVLDDRIAVLEWSIFRAKTSTLSISIKGSSFDSVTGGIPAAEKKLAYLKAKRAVRYSD